MNTPRVNIFFLPYMSEILPSGTRNIAAASRYAVDTQPSKMAFIDSCLPIDGKAMATLEPRNGVMKEPSVVTSRAAVRLGDLSDDGVAFLFCMN